MQVVRWAAGGLVLALAAVFAATAVLSLAMAVTGEYLGAADHRADLDESRPLLVLYAGVFTAGAGALALAGAMVMGRRLLRRTPPVVVQRVAAAFAAPVAIAAALGAAFFSFWGFATAALRPDPRIPDGDPCCGHPDTYGEVVAAAGWGLVFAFGAVATAGVAVLLARRAAGRSVSAHGAWAALCVGTSAVVCGGFLAWILVAQWLGGDYP